MTPTDKVKQKLIKMLVSAKKAEENKKFGEFIIQTNRVQFYLSNLLLFRSSYADKEYMEYIKGAQFGNLIYLFCACAERKTGEVILIPRLRKYRDERNRLAHKMYSAKKLTKEECEKAIKEGEEILRGLKVLTDEEIKRIGKKNKI